MAQDSYATLLNKKLVIPSQKTNYVAVNRSHFIDLLMPHIRNIYVDEAWYLELSPDVRDAVEKMHFASASDHYYKVGYFEHRMPYLISVDENWYTAQYPDIHEAVRSGVFESGKAHFYEVGFREGRFPHAGFLLRTIT